MILIQLFQDLVEHGPVPLVSSLRKAWRKSCHRLYRLAAGSEDAQIVLRMAKLRSNCNKSRKNAMRGRTSAKIRSPFSGEYDIYSCARRLLCQCGAAEYVDEFQARCQDIA